jgi:hypothetical protein
LSAHQPGAYSKGHSFFTAHLSQLKLSGLVVWLTVGFGPVFGLLVVRLLGFDPCWKGFGKLSLLQQTEDHSLSLSAALLN